MMSEAGEVSVVKGEVSLLLSAIRRSNRWMGHGRIVSTQNCRIITAHHAFKILVPQNKILMFDSLDFILKLVDKRLVIGNQFDSSGVFMD